MTIDQVSNVVTMAAALSMVGWVTRPLDDMHFFQPGGNEIDYFGHLQQHWLHNQDLQLTNTSPQLQTASVSYDVNDNFQHSKFVSEFTGVDELRDLVSWQEAYRRGDLSFFRYATNSYAYPLQQYNEIPSEYHQDDGYGSGDVASPSAASDISSLFSLDSPTASHLLDLNDLGVADLFNTDPCTSNGNEASRASSNDALPNIATEYPTTLPGDGEFDLEQLFGDNLYDLYDSFPRTQVEPSNSATSSGNNPDFASPFIEQHFDDYLGSFTQPDEQNSLDDPFCMQFTEPSNSLDELLTGFDCLPYSTAVDGDITSPYDNSLDNNILDGRAETMDSIEGSSQNSYAGPSSVGVFSAKSCSVADHDYAKEFKEEEDVLPPRTEQIEPELRNVVDSLAHNLYKNQRDAGENKMEYEPKEAQISALETSRTFAPSVRKSSSKRMKQDSTMVLPELPYTREELAAMDIDRFNRVIKCLDYRKQTYLKDVRKKGKNKFAARNCRKRKMDVLDGLDTNVENLEKQREMLLHEQKLLLEETRQIHEKTAWLSDYILQHLLDESGNPYSESYTLEYTADGNVYLVPSLVKTEGKVAQDV